MTDRAAAIEATTAISRVVESLLKENAALRASLVNHDAGMQTLRAQHQTACDERDRNGRRIRRLQEELASFVEEHGVEHEDQECPEDDTCTCPNVAALNALLKETENV